MTTIAGQHVPHHWLRIFVIWAVLTVIAEPLLILLVGPHIPPGRMTAEAGSQTDANTVLLAICAPIVILVVVYFGYALIVFRERTDTITDGPPIRGNNPMQAVWLVATSAIVLALAVWGSYTLVGSANGAGGGQGPSPADKPGGWKSALPVQVIGQQWEWTFRYPANGGFETRQLYLPVNRVVALHVTSLDVTHSFWAYELGVKADAVPGVDNVAYVTTRDPGTFHIRCAELCGLWHAHMARVGHVVGTASFKKWIQLQRRLGAAGRTNLPQSSRTYYPEPLHRAG
jgi:cytochrome c oxidase subunit II